RPNSRRERDTHVYRPNSGPVPESVAVNVRNRSHSITAPVAVPEGVVPEGVLLALGSVLGGFSLYLRQGRLQYVHNLYGTVRSEVTSDAVIGAGPHELTMRFTKTAEYT